MHQVYVRERDDGVQTGDLSGIGLSGGEADVLVAQPVLSAVSADVGQERHVQRKRQNLHGENIR